MNFVNFVNEFRKALHSGGRFPHHTLNSSQMGFSSQLTVKAGSQYYDTG